MKIENLVFVCFALLIATGFSGCSKDEDSGEVNNSDDILSGFETCELYVRFSLPDGTNALELIGKDSQDITEYVYNHSAYYIGNLNVEIYNERSGKKVTPSEIEKQFVLDNSNSTGLSNQGIMLRLSWDNPDGNDIPQESYNDATIIKLNSVNVFGDEEDHIIKWYFHILEGKPYYDIYKCEVDGVEYPIEDDPLWKETPSHNRIHNFISMEVEIDNSIAGFLNAEIPAPLDVRPATSFFDNGFSDKLYLINSREELEEVYSGKREIPEIDFPNHTLVIGRIIIPVPCWSIRQKVFKEIEGENVLTLFLENLPEEYGAIGAFTPLYFWELCPKMTNNSLSVNYEYI